MYICGIPFKLQNFFMIFLQKSLFYLTEDEEELAGGGGCGGNSWSFGGEWLPGGVSATREGVEGVAGCMEGEDADQCWASGIQCGRYIDILAAESKKFCRSIRLFWNILRELK